MDDRLCLFFGQVLTDLTNVVEVVPCYRCCLVDVNIHLHVSVKNGSNVAFTGFCLNGVFADPN